MTNINRRPRGERRLFAKQNKLDWREQLRVKDRKGTIRVKLEDYNEPTNRQQSS